MHYVLDASFAFEGVDDAEMSGMAFRNDLSYLHASIYEIMYN